MIAKYRKMCPPDIMNIDGKIVCYTKITASEMEQLPTLREMRGILKVDGDMKRREIKNGKLEKVHAGIKPN